MLDLGMNEQCTLLYMIDIVQVTARWNPDRAMYSSLPHHRGMGGWNKPNVSR